MRFSRYGARRSALVGALLIVSMFTGATSASAEPPTRFADSDSGSVPLLDCGTFQVFDQFTLNLRGTEYYDKDGNPIRLDFHVWGTDTLYNPTNGKSFSGTFSHRESIELESGDLRVSGIAFRIAVPGEGAVVLDVGRVVFDSNGVVSVAGPHQLLAGDIEGVCAALG